MQKKFGINESTLTAFAVYEGFDHLPRMTSWNKVVEVTHQLKP